jgi:CRP/FNR family transcriptional regulator, cyclic AMP receptor protein
VESFVPGRGVTTVQTISAGDALGWSWLFPPYRWHFSARAIEPTEFVAFSASYPRQQAKEDPASGFELIKQVGTCRFSG